MRYAYKRVYSKENYSEILWTMICIKGRRQTLRRARATIVVVENQKLLNIPGVYVCSLRYPSRNAHAPSRHLWPVSLYVFGFLYKLVWNISHSKKNAVRYDKKCILVFIGLHVKYPLVLSGFNESLIFAIRFGKIFNFFLICTLGASLLHAGRRTDIRVDKANR
jgi:hypothetical protein